MALRICSTTLSTPQASRQIPEIVNRPHLKFLLGPACAGVYSILLMGSEGATSSQEKSCADIPSLVTLDVMSLGTIGTWHVPLQHDTEHS
eukprot:880436-Amphidinium_carterae.1